MSTIKLRRDTAANWLAANPILSLAEPGLETDTNKIKYGDGTSHWSSLPYAGGGGTIWTNPANGCLRAELSETGFEAFTDASHLDLQDSGEWNIGSYQNSTFIGNDQFTNTNILSLKSGDETYITTNLRENGNHQWKFGTDGRLTFPDTTVQTTAYVNRITIIRAQRRNGGQPNNTNDEFGVPYWTFTTIQGDGSATFNYNFANNPTILITLTGFTEIPAVAQIFDNLLQADGGWRDTNYVAPGQMNLLDSVTSGTGWVSPGSPNILTTFTPATHKFAYQVAYNTIKDFYFYFKE